MVKRKSKKKKVAPRFVQIAVSSGDDVNTYDTLYGLDANGRVWEYITSPHRDLNGWRLIENNLEAIR